MTVTATYSTINPLTLTLRHLTEATERWLPGDAKDQTITIPRAGDRIQLSLWMLAGPCEDLLVRFGDCDLDLDSTWESEGVETGAVITLCHCVPYSSRGDTSRGDARALMAMAFTASKSPQGKMEVLTQLTAHPDGFSA